MGGDGPDLQMVYPPGHGGLLPDFLASLLHAASTKPQISEDIWTLWESEP